MKKLVLISTGICTFLTIVVLVVVFMATDIDMKNVKNKFAGKEHEYFSKPFEITTNIDINGGRSNFIKAKVIVSTPDKKVGAHLNEEYGYPIQDILVTYINGQTAEKITKPENRGKIKDELSTLIEKNTKIVVKDVYFVDFMIQ